MVEQSDPVEASNIGKPRAPVLVSGASFAGLATAHWLIRLGYRVTLVELSSGLRKGGTPVDIEGETVDVLARMGMLDAVKAKALPPRRFEFKDAVDDTIGSFGGGQEPVGAAGEKYEIHRDDLLQILFASTRGNAEMVFGRSISRLDEGSHGVDVTFSDGSRGTYTLVFGCDGNRSAVRRLVFGDTAQFTHFMDGYFLIKVAAPTGLVPANTSQIFSVPGRTALLNGYVDRTDIVLAFRSGRQVDCDHRDRAEQRRMIHRHFDGLGWKVPAMLDAIDADHEFYFDALDQIRMPTWSKGRVVLVGDAGYCVSPVAGMGGSVAIIGAARLADALARHTDHVAAFRDYESGLRPLIDEVQEKAVAFGMATMFPSNDAEIAERDRKLREGLLDL